MPSDFWKKYTGSTKPLAKKSRTPSAPRAVSLHEASRKNAEKIPLKKVAASHTASDLSPNVANALERKREQALREGAIELDARLDLHGMTQDEAFEALAHFIRRCVKTGKRHLLVITGKGPDNNGVLRRHLRPWLAQLPEAPQILALRQAAPKHGGRGAFYILLRKNRTTS